MSQGAGASLYRCLMCLAHVGTLSNSQFASWAMLYGPHDDLCAADMPWGAELVAGPTSFQSDETEGSDIQPPAKSGFGIADQEAPLVAPRLSEALLQHTLRTLLANWEVRTTVEAQEDRDSGSSGALMCSCARRPRPCLVNPGCCDVTGCCLNCHSVPVSDEDRWGINWAGSASAVGARPRLHCCAD